LSGRETQSDVSHAGLEPSQRLLKAEKIRRLVETVRPWEGARVLDIGTGAGVIASALAQAVGPQGEVHSVDVVDERVFEDGFQFEQVTDESLPFPDESFDIVLSNHVIEHVGDEPAQRRHAAEIHRVLRPDGVLYLATATRWLVMEPHYHLPFLSWLPRPAAGLYLRATGRGREYDCFLPTHRWLRKVLAETGFAWKEPVFEAMRLMAEIEEPSGLTKVVLTAPKPVLGALRPIVPTIVFLARKNGSVAR
jgi:ubiquinone/menaquinone biosynthesis C-methylase UbiE